MKSAASIDYENRRQRVKRKKSICLIFFLRRLSQHFNGLLLPLFSHSQHVSSFSLHTLYLSSSLSYFLSFTPSFAPHFLLFFRSWATCYISRLKVQKEEQEQWEGGWRRIEKEDGEGKGCRWMSIVKGGKAGLSIYYEV